MGKEKNNIKKIYSLSPMQTMMLFNSIKSKDSEEDPYFRQLLIDVDGEIEFSEFKKSVELLVDRFDILRTIFVYEKIKQPMQVVLENKSVPVTYRDLSDLTEEEKVSALEKIKEDDRKRHFNLSKEILTRMMLIKLGTNKYKILWSNHHILMDGWCGNIVINDLLQLYECVKDKKKVNLPKVNQYDNYINWLKKQDKKEALNYWSEYLSGYKKAAGIPSNKKVSNDYIAKEKIFTFSKEITNKIEKLALDLEVTLSTVINILWSLVLQSYNEVNDVMFGMVVSGRTVPVSGVESIVGLFINTVPLRIKVDERTSLKELAGKIQESIIFAEKNSYVLLTEILASADLKNNMLNHMAVIENYPGENKLKNKYFTLSSMNSEEKTNYDFNILFYPGDKLKARFSYNENLYDDRIMELVMKHLNEFAQNICRYGSETLFDEVLKKKVNMEMKNLIEELEIEDILKENLTFIKTPVIDEGNFEF